MSLFVKAYSDVPVTFPFALTPTPEAVAETVTPDAVRDRQRGPGGLPASAHRHRARWSNQSGSSHVKAGSWLDAGYSVAEVDMAGSYVTFERPVLGEH
jgi:hypothetical protein